MSEVRHRTIDDQTERHVHRSKRKIGFTRIVDSDSSLSPGVTCKPTFVSVFQTLIFSRINHRPSLICTTARACMVRQLPLTALWTGNDIRGGYLLVGPALIALGLGCFSFRYWHGLSPNSLFSHNKATILPHSKMGSLN